MSNDSYVDRLVLALEEKSYSFTEIKKCCDYANHLISAGLPVLFDEGHVRLVLQLEKIGYCQELYANWFADSG